jgi:hypothetical protein
MKQRVREIAIQDKVATRDEAFSILTSPGDLAIVERGGPRIAVLRCPCGCGDDLVINLDHRAGRAWRYYQNFRGITLYPSYWREDGCESHFIVWNNHIFWCMWDDDDFDEWSVSPLVEEAVLAALPNNRFIHYYDLAEQIGLIPWEVLQACRQLTRRGEAAAGKRKQHGQFRRREPHEDR